LPSYKIASEEGAQRYGHEIGETVELDIPNEELAVIAAGWLEPVKDSKEKQ
jgi:hypothetical protein